MEELGDHRSAAARISLKLVSNWRMSLLENVNRLEMKDPDELYSQKKPHAWSQMISAEFRIPLTFSEFTRNTSKPSLACKAAISS